MGLMRPKKVASYGLPPGVSLSLTLLILVLLLLEVFMEASVFIGEKLIKLTRDHLIGLLREYLIKPTYGAIALGGPGWVREVAAARL